jgi:hypothetical protein
MYILNFAKGLALLGLLLTACATSAPTMRENAETPEVVSSSWDEARADPTCVVPMCGEARCAVWRCQDVAEVEPHPVLLAQATVTQPLSLPPLVQGPGASRWWGHPLAEPNHAAPVFEIPWHNWKTRQLSAPKLFKDKNPDVPPEEVWRFAGELMSRFGVNGPLVPYYCE